MDRVRNSVLWIKIVNWEFWPFGVLYLPVFFYWAWLCMKARSFFFFTASNPGIEYGGMLFESKSKILDKIPETIKPRSLFVKANQITNLSSEYLRAKGFEYPIIAKPDIGERGWGVTKISDSEKLAEYISNINYDIIIQEYIDYPIELGVFYMRYPNQEIGKVTSVVMKDLLSVTGDGEKNIRQLMLSNYRGKLYIKGFENSQTTLLEKVPEKDQKIVLEDIGNHCRGTTFLNANWLINSRLNDTFDKISSEIDGFYFGRFDLRCKSYEDLYSGNVKIMELNGAGSEPGHIYHPGASLRDAYSSIFYHQRKLLEISMINKSRGIDFLSFQDGIKSIIQLSQYRKARKLAPEFN